MERTPVESSLIRSVGYDLPSSILELELVQPNRVYEYYDVPFSVYNELMEAPSKGSYFNDFIKDLYAFQEVEDPAPPPESAPADVASPEHPQE